MVVFGMFAAAAVACSLSTNLDPLKGADSCGDGNVCRAAVPQGWQGPVTLVGGDESVGCAAPFGSKVIGTVLDQLDGGAAACTCTCAPTQGSCIYQTQFYNVADCVGSPLAPEAGIVNTCAPNLFPTFSFRWLDGGVGPDAGCTATAVPTTSPPTSTSKHLCLGAFPQSNCASGSCMPTSATACIASEGDLTCPAPFTKRSVLYKSIDDRRSCTGCACGFNAAACKSPMVFRMTAGNCASDGGTIATFSAVAGCTSATIDAGTSARGEIPNACTVTAQGTPSGAVMGRDPVTVCCQP